MSSAPVREDLRERMQRMESLLDEVEQTADPATRERVLEIVQTLLEFHRQGLARMIDHLGQSESDVLGDMADDELIGSLLALHGLHPVGLGERVRRAIDEVQPALALHHGHVRLLGVSDEGEVSLRLEGNCHGCPSSQLTLKNAIEEAIYAAAPEVTAILVEGVTPEAGPGPDNGFVPLGHVTRETTVLYPEGCAIPSRKE